MKHVFWIAIFCLMEQAVSAGYPSHNFSICGIAYTVTASLEKKKKDLEYCLTIKSAGLPDRVMKLGIIKNQFSKKAILKALRDSLHMADLFTSCPTALDSTDQQIESIINILFFEVFPYTNVYLLSEQVINDNNKLHLLEESSDSIFQLTNVTPVARVPLLTYNVGLLTYEFNWVNILANPLIGANFDKLLQLYFRMPASTVKPYLYLLPQPLANNYLIYESHDGITALPTAMSLTKLAFKKLTTAPADPVIVAGTSVNLIKILDPNSKEASKKQKDDDPSKLKEE